MQELIKIQHDNNRITVSARDLHEFLEIGAEFAKWMQRMCGYGFTEHIDYEVIVKNDENSKGGRPSSDYQLTLEMAKEISMIQRNEKGKQARQYFIQCEKAAQEAQVKLPTSPMEVMKLMFDAMTDTNKDIKDLKEQVNTIESKLTTTWQDQMLEKVKEYCEEHHMLHAKVLGKLYKEIEAQANMHLDIRLKNLKERHKKAGATHAECKGLRKIDIIAADGCARALFESLLDQMSNKKDAEQS